MIAFKISRFGFALLLAVLGSAAPPRASAQRPQRKPTPNDTLKSTEVAPDRKVTFRIYAPKADEVSVGGDFGQGGKMTKDDQGVWSLTVGPLAPDFYSYTFTVDGVRTVDPKNPMIKQGVSSLDSMFLVPGDEAEFEATKDVPARRGPRRLVSLGHARQAPPDARLHAARLRGERREVPGLLPAARRRRRGLGLEHDRPRPASSSTT